MVEEKIGKRIQVIRKKKGFTQEALSEALSISPNYMSALERGKYNIKPQLLVDIMNILDCTADDVFCDVINTGHKHKEALLSEEISKLPQKEQERIFAVLETMIEQAKND